MSAPTPSLRCRELSRKPWVMPTSVRIEVTENEISRMLSSVRTGRNRTFSQTSLKTTLLRRSDNLQLRSLRLIQRELFVRKVKIHLHFDHVKRYAIFILGAVDIDVRGKHHAIVLLPLRISGIADQSARFFIPHCLANDGE